MIDKIDKSLEKDTGLVNKNHLAKCFIAGELVHTEYHEHHIPENTSTSPYFRPGDYSVILARIHGAHRIDPLGQLQMGEDQALALRKKHKGDHCYGEHVLIPRWMYEYLMEHCPVGNRVEVPPGRTQGE